MVGRAIGLRRAAVHGHLVTACHESAADLLDGGLEPAIPCRHATRADHGDPHRTLQRRPVLSMLVSVTYGRVDASATCQPSKLRTTGTVVADPDTYPKMPTPPGVCRPAVPSLADAAHAVGSVDAAGQTFARTVVGSAPVACIRRVSCMPGV